MSYFDRIGQKLWIFIFSELFSVWKFSFAPDSIVYINSYIYEFPQFHRKNWPFPIGNQNSIPYDAKWGEELIVGYAYAGVHKISSSKYICKYHIL